MASYEDHFEIQTAVTDLVFIQNSTSIPPRSPVEKATAHFPRGCSTVSFPIHFNSMGCFCCFHVTGPACEPRALINPLLPLKRYRTSIIDAADCCHLEVSLRKLITRVARLPAAAAAATALFPPRPPSRWIALAGWRHSLFPLSRRRRRSGGGGWGVLGPLRRRRCKKKKNEAVSIVTRRATRGRRAARSPHRDACASIGAVARKRNNNPTRLMNIDHGGGAFKTACRLFFVQYLMREGLRSAIYYACLQRFEEVTRYTRRVTLSCPANALLRRLGGGDFHREQPWCDSVAVTKRRNESTAEAFSFFLRPPAAQFIMLCFVDQE